MELTLIIRSQAEMADAVEQIVRGISDGLAAARVAAGDSQAHVLPPEDLIISGTFIAELNADDVDTTEITPQVISVQTDASPSASVVTTTVAGAQSSTETATPANRTTTRGEGGGDSSVETTDYEEIT
jgi:hypothetical protein